MQAHDELSAYLDDELSPGERRALERRLADDPALRAELAALRDTVALLRSQGPLLAPEQLTEGIRRALMHEPPPRAPVFWRPRRGALQTVAVAAAAVVVVGVAVSGSFMGERSPAMSKVQEPSTELDLIDDALRAERHPAKAASPPPTTPKKYPPDLDRTQDQGGAGVPGEEPEPLQGSRLDPAGELGPSAQAVQGSSSAEEPADLFGGASIHTIAVRAEDLPTIARLVQRHRGRDVRGDDPAERIASLSRGEHDMALRLPDASARNAFVRDLRQTFPGQYAERVSKRGGVSLAGAQVELRLVVSRIAPSVTGDGGESPAQSQD
ncbi:MAG: hypothetical protein EA397_16445 [Deltaproteobacteria bacterium]|nr:MAG: hypothetical protein EA397_16445 [Deltaproteobacteria bacterium]